MQVYGLTGDASLLGKIGHTDTPPTVLFEHVHRRIQDSNPGFRVVC